MAARRPFWKWYCWKSIGFFPYTQVMCQWSLDLIFKAKLKLEYGNWKIQYGRPAAILKVTSLKINRLLPIATNNMHMKLKFQSKLQLRSGNHVAYRRTDRQTDRRTRWFQYTTHQLRWAGGYNDEDAPPKNFDHMPLKSSYSWANTKPEIRLILSIML